MRRRLTGLTLPWLGASWETIPGDKEVARQVITFMEDRRVLFVHGTNEGEHFYVESALAIRSFLTQQITQVHGAELAASLRAMRAAARHFVDAGGPYGENFRVDPRLDSSFARALGEFRALVGVQIARIAMQFDLPVEDSLMQMLPPPDEDDLGLVPGLDDN